MQFPSIPNSLLLLLALRGGVNAAASSDDKAKTPEPCTVASTSGAFYDLRPLSILPLEPGKKAAKGEKIDDWHAKGYDYHDSKANFTLNICAPLVDQKEDYKGLDKKLWQNVSAQYQLGSDRYSIG